MKKNGLLLALAAGTCVAPVAFAQTSDEVFPVQNEVRVDASRHPGSVVGEFGGYGERVDLMVYDRRASGAAGFGLGQTALQDDITFGGPGATGDVTINGLALYIISRAVVDAANDHGFARFTFTDVYDSTQQATAGPWADASAGATDTRVILLDLGTGWAGAYAPNTGLNYGVVTINPLLLEDAFIGLDRSVGCKVELFTDAAGTTAWTPMVPALSVGSLPTVGSSVDPLQLQRGVYTNVSPVTYDWFATGGPPSAGSVRGLFGAFRGTGYPAPRPTTELVNPTGCLQDGVTTRSASTSGAAPKWYTFCLNSDATDLSSQFLDIDTEGSAGDTVVALYSSTGNLLMVDDGSGSGTNDQFSFGIGRRAAVGDGSQYDGRDTLAGLKGLPAGEYDFVVAPAGATFDNGWAVASAAPSTSFTLHFNTNTNGATLAPSVAPALTADLDLSGQIIAPGAALPQTATPAFGVNWYRFTTCRDASTTNPVTIDMAGSNSYGNTHIVFDSSGNEVARENYTGVGQVNAPDIIFDGVTRSLPAGTYYLAHTYSTTDTTGSRWHVRCTDGDDGWTLTGTVNVAWLDCPSGGGCAWQADGCYADYDNSGGIDGDDVIAFFGDWDNNGMCADCDASDGVDGDDVILFFASWDANGIGFPGC